MWNIIDWSINEKKTEFGFDIVIGMMKRFAFIFIIEFSLNIVHTVQFSQYQLTPSTSRTVRLSLTS